ncbi:hypothetical protein AB0K09_32880 [Streptomyces sp. NPDC049577]|uniref:hypothetical protein n=1 Tax=Streptomyces sp. NPDC049577 TaxID=3155153 RepID=UPI003432FDBC
MSRLRNRLAATAAAALVLGAGALTAAPAAVAKANLIAIDGVALRSPGIQVDVTYSCDPGMNHQLVANATANAGTNHESVAAATIKTGKLVCDYDDHKAQVYLRPALGSHFAKGDEVQVKVYYFDDEGFSYAQQETVTVL